MNKTLKAVLKPLVRPVRFVWRRLPKALLGTRPLRWAGTFIYDHSARHASRDQSHWTCFMRNIPQLEVLRDLVSQNARGATLRIASIGCSTGAELYSALWVIRDARLDLRVVAHGVDISKAIVEIARRGIYYPNAPAREGGVYEMDGRRTLSTEPDALDGIMEATPDGGFRVKDWLRVGVSWSVGEATDPHLLDLLGPQEVVMACNFLSPMEDALAEACLRNIVRLVAPNGYLVLDGIDLDLKTRIVRSLKLTPVTDRIKEVHMADPTMRDWPWTWWGHEPFDRNRPDWAFRYSTIYVAPDA